MGVLNPHRWVPACELGQSIKQPELTLKIQALFAQAQVAEEAKHGNHQFKSQLPSFPPPPVD